MQHDSNIGINEYHRLFGHETHDNRVLFELLTVAVFQAGLSWQVAAGKIPVFRQVFADFDYQKVAGFDEPELEAIMQQPEMIKNPRKIRAIISNSRAIIRLAPKFADLNDYLWHFTEQQVWVMSIEPDQPLNQQSSLGTFVAKDMKKHGFKFVGPTTVQLLLIAAGIIQRLEK
ncbi:DNA-3-methyladenine glycosylase I [Paucilactobacillus kaifaensis]|uniref:DNA-3-methyladenine glycosylase I n=1 Tax=Paucilactobacillus kaifaensis TaxID=2559921 RepID=UPI0010F75CD9|nr:DNA-3-methyladenine glycosylase I [Paucilactobacillus kaifaensis]